jgi:transcription antitermination factor NusG
MSKQWYVLRAVSGQEKKVKTYIESEIERLKLEDQVAQVLIPTEKVFEMRNGKKKIRERSSGIFRVSESTRVRIRIAWSMSDSKPTSSARRWPPFGALRSDVT